MYSHFFKFKRYKKVFYGKKSLFTPFTSHLIAAQLLSVSSVLFQRHFMHIQEICVCGEGVFFFFSFSPLFIHCSSACIFFPLRVYLGDRSSRPKWPLLTPAFHLIVLIPLTSICILALSYSSSCTLHDVLPGRTSVPWGQTLWHIYPSIGRAPNTPP